MSEENQVEKIGDVPLMQKILDNPFMLLFIGIAIPSLTYLIWGVMELIAIPIAR